MKHAAHDACAGLHLRARRALGSFTLDVTIDLPARGITALFGPSGSGKTSCLRVLAGLDRHANAQVVVGGQIWQDSARGIFVPTHRRALGYVFQEASLFSHLTVRDNLTFGHRRTPVAERSRSWEHPLELLGIAPLLARWPHELSGGQRQRVAIGRAIVRTPKIFLFDEPLSNLDAALRVATRIEIAKLHRDLKATMIYVTHDQVEAMTLADKIVVLRAGRVEQVGKPMELYNNPANTFVAGFIGSPQMNMLSGAALGIKAHTLGIRPEHLAISRDKGDLAGRVSHVEKLGGETLVYVQVDGQGLLTVRLLGEYDWQVDEPVHLTPDQSRAFLFDAEGLRIRD